MNHAILGAALAAMASAAAFLAVQGLADLAARLAGRRAPAPAPAPEPPAPPASPYERHLAGAPISGFALYSPDGHAAGVAPGDAPAPGEVRSDHGRYGRLSFVDTPAGAMGPIFHTLAGYREWEADGRPRVARAAAPPARGLAVVPLAGAVLARWLADGTPATEVVDGALPADATLAGVGTDGINIYLTFESADFPAVAAGDGPPARAVTLRRIGAAPAYFAAGFGPAAGLPATLPVGP